MMMEVKVTMIRDSRRAGCPTHEMDIRLICGVRLTSSKNLQVYHLHEIVIDSSRKLLICVKCILIAVESCACRRH